jgi:hypothetical protein
LPQIRKSDDRRLNQTGRKRTYDQKFDPAPVDKHDANPKEAAKADKSKSELNEGLEESFPGSDPASATQPKKP